jgi:hypothetical protein
LTLSADWAKALVKNNGTIHKTNNIFISGCVFTFEKLCRMCLLLTLVIMRYSYPLIYSILIRKKTINNSNDKESQKT